jgi:hypothetical protein
LSGSRRWRPSFARRLFLSRLHLALLVAVVLGGPLAGLAAAEVDYRVNARLDPVQRTVTGGVVIQIVNHTSRPLTHVPLWLYADRFARRPALNDIQYYWLYPTRFDPGAMRLTAVAVDGTAVPPSRWQEVPGPWGDRGLVRIQLARPLAPGERLALSARFEVKVPRRYGLFGVVNPTIGPGPVMTLTGGFFPFVPELGEAGFDLEAPPPPARFQLQLEVPGASHLVINGQHRPPTPIPVPPGARRAPPPPPWRLVEQEVHDSWPVVVVHPHVRVLSRQVAGVELVYFHGSKRPPPPPRRTLFPYIREDYPALVVDAMAEALKLLDDLKLRPAGLTRLVAMEAPLRGELASAQPGMVLISERVYRIFPHSRLRKFHTFQLVRQLAAQMLGELPSLKAAGPKDRGWVADALGTFVSDVYTLVAHGKREYARDVLKYISFVPLVDALIYNPQVEFQGAYFGSVSDPDPLRDDLRRFSNRQPRGKVVYEKLKDILGLRGLTLWVRRIADQKMPVREAARSVGKDLPQAVLPPGFFAQWLGTYPQVDYRFRSVKSERLGKRRYRHTIVIERRGDRIVEPVELAVSDDAGEKRTLRWDGQGDSHTFVIESKARLDVVQIDPHGRTVQELPGVNEDLRLGDRRPPRWKFVYNNFGALLNVSELAVNLSIDFSLSRIYDLKNYLGFVVARTQVSDILVQGRYTRAFGEKVHSNRLTSGFTTSLTVSRINGNFGITEGMTPQPGVSISVGAGLSYDNRFYAVDPRHGRSIGISGRAATLILDTGKVLPSYSGSVGAVQLWQLHPAHLLAGYLSGSIVGGDLRVPSQLVAIGGPYGLRGYATDELLGRAAVTAGGEWRHTFVRDLDINVVHVAYGRGIQGVVFAEGGTLSDCSVYSDIFGKGTFFGDVGYGVRAFFDWLGASQSVLSIDVALPLNRQARACLGNHTVPSSFSPVGFYVSFGAQSF